MIPQDNTHFRFRFSLVLYLAFLLTSPTQASSAAESCAAVALAWKGIEVKFSLGKDAQFVRNLADCFNGVKKGYTQIQGIIKQLPEVIDKVLPVAKKEGLVLLSVYLLYNSFVLYDEAKILEVNAKIYRDRFEALEKEMKPFRDFIDTELIPQWENLNTADLEKIIDRLLQRMGRFSTVIQELTQDIRSDYKKSGSNQRYFYLYAVCGGVLCLYSIVSPTPYVSIPVCGAALGTVGFSCWSYNSLCETLPKLDLLEKDSTKMKQEITSYMTIVDLTKMRAELRGEL